MWCIGQLTPQYRQRMYAVLDLYQRPYNCAEPVVCVDEKSKQLLAAKHPDLPVKPGYPCKIDYEYERKGTRNLFVAVEPLAGWRQVQVTRHRKKVDFVYFIRQLLQGRYRHAKKSIWYWITLTPTLPVCLWKSSDRNERRSCSTGLSFITLLSMAVG